MLRTRTEWGATAIFVAATLTLLFGILAIAVDVGFGFNERRIDQTAADAAALAGSLELVISDQANGLEAAIDRVYAIVDANLDRTVSLADWQACTDPSALFYTTLSDLGAANGSDCISLSADFNVFRVRVPVQGVDANFAPVIGAETVDVSAAAEAARNAEFGGGGDIPFYVLQGVGVGTELCVKTGTNSAQQCGGPSSGNFGDFVPFFYGPVGGDDSTICELGQQPRPLARVVSDGIDHDLSRFAPFPGGTERLNGGWCLASGIPGPLMPNTIQPGSGYSANDITWGLALGATYPTGQDFPGRLTRSDTSVTAQDTGTASIFGADIDNKPLWDYLDLAVIAANTGVLPSCDYFSTSTNRGHSADIVQYDEQRQYLIGCIAEADAEGLRIFTSALLDTPRLGAAPQVWEDFPPPNNNYHMHIQGLVPVFIDSLYAEIVTPHFSCNGLDETIPGLCVHRAGIDGSMTVQSPGQRVFQSAGAIVLSCAIIPEGACPTLQDPTQGSGLTFLYELELTK